MKLLSGSSSVRRYVRSMFLLVLFIAPNVRGADDYMHACCAPQELAFARYLPSQQQREAFARSETVGIFIQASLPDLYKSAALAALRPKDADDPRKLQVTQITGDGTVVEEVIDQYFAFRRQIEKLPLSSIAITPANYKFRFAGEVKTGGAAAYVYDIAPKKKRPGMIAGQLWMDAATGQEVMLTGHLLSLPAPGRRVEIVRDTKLINGSAGARVTHVAFTIPRLGRAELVITEIVLDPEVIRQSE